MQHGPQLHMGSAKKNFAFFEVALKSKREVADRTYEYTFEKPEGFHFLAGQHIRMSLVNPPKTDAKGDSRFFTMASTPDEPDLKFTWRITDSAFKQVIDRMQPGEKIVVQKMLGEAPKGSFVLHDNVAVPAVFIVGGIGIVPAYAMVKDSIKRKLGHTMYLFYSNRRPEDAAYLSELQELAQQNPNFKLIATMTEPEKSVQKWNGETGFINQVMLQKHVSELRTPIYYISGLPEMVSAILKVLDEAGVSKDNIHAEEFTGFKMGEGMHQGKNAGQRQNHLLLTLVGSVIIILIAIYFLIR